jgi:hypothetical protein
MQEQYTLLGYDTFAEEEYSLGDPKLDGMQPSYPTRQAALEDARKHLAYLERMQPSDSSEGQGQYGIQDRVYIVHPGGRKERVFPVLP